MSSGTVLFAMLLCGVAAAQQAGQLAVAARARTAAHRQWRIRGRTIRATNAADLRRRAIVEKQGMRAAGLTTGIGSGAGWISLGPSPLPSDASGMQNLPGAPGLLRPAPDRSHQVRRVLRARGQCRPKPR